MIVEFTVLPTYEDYIAANWLILGKRWFCVESAKYIAKFFGVVMLGQLLIGAVKGVGFDKFMPLAWAVSSLLLTAIWFGLRLLVQAVSLPKIVRKAYEQSQTIQLPTTFRLSEEGLFSENSRVSANFDWSLIDRAIESARLLVLVTVSWRQFYVFPKSQLDAGTLDAIRATLVAAKVPTR